MQEPLGAARTQDRAGRVQADVPATRAWRQSLVSAARQYVRLHRPVPPLSLEELSAHTDRLLESSGTPQRFRRFAAVVLNNETWRERLTAVPYSRRLLLLPQCLRHPAACPATVDSAGLLCARCGACAIGEIQSEAERLGYVVLVAEGSPVVTHLIQSGQVQAVVGVSCLDVLERVFPYMEAAAIPGAAVPLLRDGCSDTAADLEWVWEALYTGGDDRPGMPDLEATRRQVEAWFAPEAMEEFLGPAAGTTERIARDWLVGAGKRWRPFLTLSAFRALCRDPGRLDDDVRRVALAVECFHKASLVHDDIEDGDASRYGQPTLHERFGVPVALNVGDFLLGEGYRLIAQCQASRAPAMLRVAAEGHRQLCLGQGAELCWRREPRPMSTGEVLEVFRGKTAPAFEVALRLGAICADADDACGQVLRQYSRALGVAYQISDDIGDLAGSSGADLDARRPSFLLALAHQRAAGKDKALVEAQWCGTLAAADRPRLAAILAELKVVPAAQESLSYWRGQALSTLPPLEEANLKALLRRVLAKIFDEAPPMGCCDEHTRPDAPDRPSGGRSAG